MVFASGGKWTTYREMAEDAVDEAIAAGSLHYSRECRTLDIGLVGKEGAQCCAVLCCAVLCYSVLCMHSMSEFLVSALETL